MKKKIIILALVLMLVCLVIFSGCGGRYTNAYVKIGEEWVDLEISHYLAYRDGVFELTLTDGTRLWVHGINCFLYNGELPIQGGNND